MKQFSKPIFHTQSRHPRPLPHTHSSTHLHGVIVLNALKPAARGQETRGPPNNPSAVKPERKRRMKSTEKSRRGNAQLRGEGVCHTGPHSGYTYSKLTNTTIRQPDTHQHSEVKSRAHWIIGDSGMMTVLGFGRGTPAPSSPLARMERCTHKT